MVECITAGCTVDPATVRDANCVVAGTKIGCVVAVVDVAEGGRC